MVFAALILTAPLVAQPAVPPRQDAESSLLPTGVSPDDVHIDGQFAYIWQSPEGAQVVHVVGDFRMDIGGRSLRAGHGVVWMTPRTIDGRNYLSFEVFLFHAARVVEPAGTVTEGPLLFVTLGSSGNVELTADKRAFASSADTALYRDAAAVRDRVRAGSIGDRQTPDPKPITVTPDRLRVPLPPPEFHFTAEHTTLARLDDGRQVISCTGSVTLLRGAVGGGDALELQADAAVVFMQKEDAGADDLPQLANDPGDATGMGGAGVEAVYLEGDIRMSFGDRNVRASRLYYDLARDRALILDAVAYATIPDRDLPIYLRADEVRQLSAREYAADNAILTTSEFHTPHYHIGAERIEIIDRTPRTVFGGAGGFGRASFRMKRPTFNLYGVPLLPWPVAAGRLPVSESAIRRVSTGYDGDFGARFETKWDLSSLLSFEAPEGVEADLILDYFSDRGPAVGLDMRYERDEYYGIALGYSIDDSGKDTFGELKNIEPESTSRGRATWRHRHYLPDDWQLTLEMSYISDRGFLEEYFRSEFYEGKDQETLVYLKKQRENWAFTAIVQWRLNDFFKRTERLPDFSFRLIGQPLEGLGSLYSENRLGWVRYRAAEKDIVRLLLTGSDGPSSGATARVDTRQEITFPFILGPLKLAPFVMLRGTAWDDAPSGGFRSRSPGNRRGGGGLGRIFASYGIRGGAYFWKVFPDYRNELLDIDGVRHVIQPEVVAWMSHSNTSSDKLYPFDQSVEGIDEFDGVLFALRQRWQTRRGAPDKRRVVDWLKMDVELGVFNDGRSTDATNGFVSFSRPENSVSRNFLNSATVWRINDATVLLSEMNYDLNDGEVDVFDLGLQVHRTPRLSYGVDYRFIDETESNLLGLGLNYKVDQKHTLGFREVFDIERGRTLDFSVAYVRKYPRWFVAVVFELDEANDNAGVSLSIWPEGAPRAALGSRRFTGLAISTAMTPDY